MNECGCCEVYVCEREEDKNLDEDGDVEFIKYLSTFVCKQADRGRYKLHALVLFLILVSRDKIM